MSNSFVRVVDRVCDDNLEPEGVQPEVGVLVVVVANDVRVVQCQLTTLKTFP